MSSQFHPPPATLSSQAQRRFYLQQQQQQQQQHNDRHSSSDSDYRIMDSPETDIEVPNQQPFMDIGELTNKFVEDNPDNPATGLYEHLLNIPDPQSHGDWQPFQNGVHYVLYLLGRTHKHLGNSAESMMDAFIQVLWTMGKSNGFVKQHGSNGVFKESIDLYKYLPRNWKTLKKYDKCIPFFPTSCKNIVTNIKKNPEKDKDAVDFAPVLESKSYNVEAPDNVEYYPNENPAQPRAYNLENYEMYTKKHIIALEYHDPVWHVAFWNMTGYFLNSLSYRSFRPPCANFPQNCSRFSNKCGRCLNYPVLHLQSSQWMEYHNVLQHGDYIPELSNHTTIFLHDLLYRNGNKNVLYYVYEIKVMLDPRIQRLQHGTQQEIKESYNNNNYCVRQPCYRIKCKVIKYRIVEQKRVWCIVKAQTCLVRRDSNYKHSEVSYTLVKHAVDTFGNVSLAEPLSPVLYQAPAVSQQQPYVLFNVSHDGKPVGSGLHQGLEMTYLTIANSKLRKDDQNIIRFCVTGKKTAHRYVLATLVEKLQHFRSERGVNFVVKDPSSRMGFYQTIGGELALTLGDLDAVRHDMYSPGCSVLNRNDGKTFASTKAEDALNLSEPHSRTISNMFHPTHKRNLHKFVHQVIVDKRCGLQQWQAYPKTLGSTGFSVANTPHSLYIDYANKPYPYNFQVNLSNCYFHNIASSGAPMDRWVQHIVEQYGYYSLSFAYNSLKDHFLEQNAKTHSIRPKSMVTYHKLFKVQQMHHTLAKWFLVITCFNTLFGYKDFIRVLHHYLNLLTRVLQVRNEKQRLQLVEECKKVYETLQTVFDIHLTNTPKSRIFKDIIDIDLFYFANQQILQNFYTEFAHQTQSVLWSQRNNHLSQHQTTQSKNHEMIHRQNPHIFKWFGLVDGVKYMLLGGLWGPNLQFQVGPSCRSLNDPHNSIQRHPLVKSFLDTHFDTERYTLCHQTSDGLIFSKSNHFPLVMFQVYSQYHQYDKYVQAYRDTPFNADQVHKKIAKWTNKFWRQQRDCTELQDLLSEEFHISFDSVSGLLRLECTPVHKLVINKSHQSNIIELCNRETDYMDRRKHKIWVKVQIPYHRIMNLQQIWRITHPTSEETRYLAFGDVYTYTESKEPEFAAAQNSEWMPHFDLASDMQQSKWCVANCVSIVESIFVTHQHTFDHITSPHQGSSQNTETHSKYLWQHDWVRYMAHRYSDHIRSMLGNGIPLPHQVPCGPIPVCTVHHTVDDCRHQKIQWICNTTRNQQFLIWDAQHSFLPGLWSNCLQRIHNIHS